MQPSHSMLKCNLAMYYINNKELTALILDSLNFYIIFLYFPSQGSDYFFASPKAGWEHLLLLK